MGKGDYSSPKILEKLSLDLLALGLSKIFAISLNLIQSSKNLR
jgi:hypothetical protein